VFGQSIHALVEDRFDEAELKKALAGHGIHVTEVRALEPSLEDVFVELTYKHRAEGGWAKE
jgi:hypothetical protein